MKLGSGVFGHNRRGRGGAEKTGIKNVIHGFLCASASSAVMARYA